MTGKQFTAFVCAICVTILAFLCVVGLIALSVSMFEEIDAIPEDNPASGSIGKAFGTIAYSFIWIVVAPILGFCALSASGVGIFTSISALKAHKVGVKVTSVIMLCINGAICAVCVIPLIILIVSIIF